MFSAEIPGLLSVSFSTWMAALALRQASNPPGGDLLDNAFRPDSKAPQPSPRLRSLEPSVPIDIIRGLEANRNGPTLGGQIVDDSLCLRFFLEPTDTLHRRYEVLRAFFVERRPLKDIAQQSSYSYNTVRDLIGDFRAQCRAGRVPPFSQHPRWADRSGTTRTHPSARTPRPLPTVEN
jgi:hypothetical protein